MTATEEVRMTSETGGQKGSKLARFDQIPTGPLTEFAEHYGKGNAKYPPAENGLDNWRNGYEWSLSYAAAQRHLNLFWSGEDIDEETGSKHLIAAAWHCFAMAFWMDNPELVEKFDNRQDKSRTPLTEAIAEREEQLADLREAFVEAATTGGCVRTITPEPEEVITELDFDPRELADGHYEDSVVEVEAIPMTPEDYHAFQIDSVEDGVGAWL